VTRSARLQVAEFRGPSSDTFKEELFFDVARVALYLTRKDEEHCINAN